MGQYTISDDAKSALDSVVKELDGLERSDKGEALFAATRYLEEALFPGMWANAKTRPSGPPVCAIWMWDGTDINASHWVQPGPFATPGDPDKGTPSPGELIVQVGPNGECVWISAPGGGKIKWCG